MYNYNQYFYLFKTIGNAKHSDKHAKYFHELDSECPYNKDNWKLQMGSRIQARTEPKAPAKK